MSKMIEPKVVHWNLFATNIEHFYCSGSHGTYFILGAIRRWMLKTNACVENIIIGEEIDENGNPYYYAHVIHSGEMVVPYKTVSERAYDYG